MKCLSLLALGALSASGSAALVNANFEQPPIGNGSYTTAGVPGWQGAASGVWNIPTAGFFVAEAPEGTQIGYSNDTLFGQTASNVLGVGTTTLTAWAGRRSDGFAGSFNMEIWAGSTLVGSVLTGGTMLSSVSFNHLSIAPASFTEISTSYTASAADPRLGQTLTVAFRRTAGSQMNFDDVRLNAAVPEPTSLVALGAMAALMLSRKRSK